jgi:hypothetical protein
MATILSDKKIKLIGLCSGFIINNLFEDADAPAITQVFTVKKGAFDVF